MPKRIWLIAVPLEPTLTPKVAVVVPLSVVKVEEASEMKPLEKVERPVKPEVDDAPR